LNAEISECEKELKYLGVELSLSGPSKGRNLIISSGDISDVDGMFALVQYAKTGADVLFVMNYPAYLLEESNENLLEIGLGLGFNYGASQFHILSGVDLISRVGSRIYSDFDAKTRKYFVRSNGGYKRGFKQALTDLAFSMVVSVWNDVQVDSSVSKGVVYFCIGGINSMNPFSTSFCKNELFVYRELLEGVAELSSIDEGFVFDSNRRKYQNGLSSLLLSYNQLYLDFNGSAAFFNESWRSALAGVQDKLKGMFVMGGVHSYETSLTMPRIKHKLNRLSCATMNQLYHPVNSASLFTFMYNMSVPVFVISNNLVIPYETYDTSGVKNDIGWQSFFISNGISNSVVMDSKSCSIVGESYLWKLSSLYYNSIYNPPRKPFDFYTALALSECLSAGVKYGNIVGDSKVMFYDDVYGITMISNLTNKISWISTQSEYMNNVNTSIPEKKDGFLAEIPVLKKAKCEYIPVFLIRFKGGTITDYRLSVLKR